MNLELIMEIQRKFAINIKSECLYQNITLKDLAKKTGISYTTILSYTKGAGSLPRIDYALRIANALDVSMEYLLTGLNSKFIPKLHHFSIVEDLKNVHINYLAPLSTLVHEIAINNQGDISNGKLQTD